MSLSLQDALLSPVRSPRRAWILLAILALGWPGPSAARTPQVGDNPTLNVEQVGGRNEGVEIAGGAVGPNRAAVGVGYTPYILGGALIVLLQSAFIVALLVQRTRRTRAERALRESEERFRLMADRAPVMMWTTRPDTTLDYLNRMCVDFTGLPIEQLLGNGWLDAVHPDDVDRCVGTYVPAFEARTPFRMEYRVRHADGSYRWLLDSGVPRYGPDGSFAGYNGCSVDITERKRVGGGDSREEAVLQASNQQIQHLAGRLIAAQEAERSRIARDLHDDTSQQLAGLAIALSSLKRRVGALHGRRGSAGGRDISSAAHDRAGGEHPARSPTTCIPACWSTPGWLPPWRRTAPKSSASRWWR